MSNSSMPSRLRRNSHATRAILNDASNNSLKENSPSSSNSCGERDCSSPSMPREHRQNGRKLISKKSSRSSRNSASEPYSSGSPRTTTWVHSRCSAASSCSELSPCSSPVLFASHNEQLRPASRTHILPNHTDEALSAEFGGVQLGSQSVIDVLEDDDDDGDAVFETCPWLKGNSIEDHYEAMEFDNDILEELCVPTPDRSDGSSRFPISKLSNLGASSLNQSFPPANMTRQAAATASPQLTASRQIKPSNTAFRATCAQGQLAGSPLLLPAASQPSASPARQIAENPGRPAPRRAVTLQRSQSESAASRRPVPDLVPSSSEDRKSVPLSRDVRSEADVCSPLPKLQSAMQSDHDYEYPLPLTDTRHCKRKYIRAYISGETLSRLLKGEYAEHFTHVLVLDCRFSFEYDGGHILNAQRAWLREHVLNHLFYNPQVPFTETHRTAVVFHCEFSAQRGPDQYEFARCLDDIFSHGTGQRLWPNMFILEKGYREFYKNYPEHCFGKYCEMKDTTKASDLAHDEQILECSRLSVQDAEKLEEDHAAFFEMRKQFVKGGRSALTNPRRMVQGGEPMTPVHQITKYR
ncbi:uncharacterized protein MONBRDRAFT_31958 [Monosiga brevicollis MX1]|uniref:protein-tyrosine-phosphatase n=1 Tax=Monosiga brevicollis TaxID=81824 RepID=A9UWH0_MONBE|nr:uncharacterized protein MONBRDRAFT_31958 [Monosiga brevicollis MX1]EDQ90044.1 predicted protein [Monosiga brevicollis MX1]|eukprot:XP_001744811.1 hypothetical protein [Monosiga brevicollis MX1]